MMEAERLDVDAAVRDLLWNLAERLGERRGVVSGVREQERTPALEPDRQQRDLRDVEIGARRGAKRAVERIRPRVVRALERRAVARAVGDDAAAVTADVDERAQLAVIRAGGDDRRSADRGGEVVSDPLQLRRVTDVLPRAGED